MRTFNINDKELVAYTNKLEKMRKFDLPLAVRGALNSTAYDMKSKTMRVEFNKNFIIRQRKFLSSVTGYNKCENTFDIDKMNSEAGVFEKENSQIVARGLLLQEKGGTIKDRAVPDEGIREGGKKKGLIVPAMYYRKFSKRKDGIIYKSGESTIIKKEKAIYRILRGGIWKTIYTPGTDVHLIARPFVEPAGNESAKKLPDNFIKNAEKRIAKYK